MNPRLDTKPCKILKGAQWAQLNCRGDHLAKSRAAKVRSGAKTPLLSSSPSRICSAEVVDKQKGRLSSAVLDQSGLYSGMDKKERHSEKTADPRWSLPNATQRHPRLQSSKDYPVRCDRNVKCNSSSCGEKQISCCHYREGRLVKRGDTSAAGTWIGG